MLCLFLRVSRKWTTKGQKHVAGRRTPGKKPSAREDSMSKRTLRLLLVDWLFRARCGRRMTPSSANGSSTRPKASSARSEEHTSELQSRGHLVCRLLLEKKKKQIQFSLQCY